MTRRRWIADEAAGDRAALTGASAEHLARVLRAKVGQEFDVVAQGHLRRGRIVSVDAERVEFTLGEELATQPELPLELLLAIFKFDRFEWAIEKATELGVARIVPVIAQRTEKHLAQAAARRVERWRKIAREAAQQSRRVMLPEIAEPARLKDVVASGGILLSEGEAERSLKTALGHSLATPVRLAIGPEGGWTADELAAFEQAGWQSASLGPTILRAETAAIAALAVAASELAGT